MEQASRKPNKNIRIAMYAGLVLIFAWSFYQNSRPLKESVQLEYRMITGIENGVMQIIMIETADRFTLPDSAFSSLFTNPESEIVSRPEQMQLLVKYSDLQYRAGFRIIENKRSVQYRLSRDQFNALNFDHPAEIEIHKKVKDSIAVVTVQR